MDPRNFVKVPILWMIGGNINFVGFTGEEEEDLSLWAFGRLGVAVKFLRMLTPPLILLIVVLSLSLEDLVGLRQEIPKRGRYNHSQGGIPDEGVIGSMGEEEDVGIGAIVTKWRENLKRGCLTFVPRTTAL